MQDVSIPTKLLFCSRPVIDVDSTIMFFIYFFFLSKTYIPSINLVYSELKVTAEGIAIILYRTSGIAGRMPFRKKNDLFHDFTIELIQQILLTLLPRTTRHFHLDTTEILIPNTASPSSAKQSSPNSSSVTWSLTIL